MADGNKLLDAFVTHAGCFDLVSLASSRVQVDSEDIPLTDERRGIYNLDPWTTL
jgi:hypothetical protein